LKPLELASNLRSHQTDGISGKGVALHVEDTSLLGQAAIVRSTQEEAIVIELDALPEEDGECTRGAAR
jgi:hypothetical protein